MLACIGCFACAGSVLSIEGSRIKQCVSLNSWSPCFAASTTSHLTVVSSYFGLEHFTINQTLAIDDLPGENDFFFSTVPHSTAVPIVVFTVSAFEEMEFCGAFMLSFFLVGASFRCFQDLMMIRQSTFAGTSGGCTRKHDPRWSLCSFQGGEPSGPLSMSGCMEWEEKIKTNFCTRGHFRLASIVRPPLRCGA